MGSDMKQKKEKAVVVLSGGQDSSTCLVHAMKHYISEVVACVFFDYGQNHCAEEFACATWWADRFSLPLEIIGVSSLKQVGKSALTSGGETSEPHPTLAELPASFVPGRNLIFLTLAAAYAQKIGATKLYTGVCETDYSGYYDCRNDTIVALKEALKLGMGFPELNIVTPLMFVDKADTFYLAWKHDELENIIEHTHTGYTGSRGHRYDWGYGPNADTPLDPASQIRADGFSTFLTRYANEIATKQKERNDNLQ